MPKSKQSKQSEKKTNEKNNEKKSKKNKNKKTSKENTVEKKAEMKKQEKKNNAKDKEKTAKAAKISPLSKIKKQELPKPVLSKTTIILLILVLLIGLAYIFRSLFIAVMVEGRPISRLKVIREAEKNAGPQILDQLVTEALIEQKAQEQGIQISDEAVDAQIEEIKESVAGQGQDFDQLLEMQGLTINELRRQIKMQLAVDAMVGADVQIDEEAIAEYLENNRDFLPEDLSDEELDDLAEQQLQQQKMGEKYQEWMDELKEEANIQYFVDYGLNNEAAL